MAQTVSPARKKLQKQANIFILAAIVLDVVANVAGRDSATGEANLISLLGVVALPCWVFGLMAYAESKGYPRRFGLLGLLCFVGFVFLVLAPNRWVEPPVSGAGSGDYPRPNG